MDRSPEEVFELLDLTEYESTALRELISLGRTTAPNLAESTGIPKARIYGVLDSLADDGYIKVIPGRPKAYQPKSPASILEQAVANHRQSFERYRHEIEENRQAFLDAYGPLFEQASEAIRPAEELFYVVDVGEASERETSALFRDADEEANVLSKSFEFFEVVEPAVADALDRGVSVRVLLLDPDRVEPENRDRRREIIDHLSAAYPAIELRFSEDRLPWRGTFIDPSQDYATGKAILLVEEEDVPNYLRQAAITENGSFVAGLKRYFDLAWRYESRPVDR